MLIFSKSIFKTNNENPLEKKKKLEKENGKKTNSLHPSLNPLTLFLRLFMSVTRH